jgi:hypothetical protein
MNFLKKIQNHWPAVTKNPLSPADGPLVAVGIFIKPL